jgi:hypothetical protein
VLAWPLRAVRDCANTSPLRVGFCSDCAFLNVAPASRPGYRRGAVFGSRSTTARIRIFGDCAVAFAAAAAADHRLDRLCPGNLDLPLHDVPQFAAHVHHRSVLVNVRSARALFLRAAPSARPVQHQFL